MAMPRRLQRRTAAKIPHGIFWGLLNRNAEDRGKMPKINKISSFQKVREENSQKKGNAIEIYVISQNRWSEDDPFLFRKHLFSGVTFHHPGWWKMMKKRFTISFETHMLHNMRLFLHERSKMATLNKGKWLLIHINSWNLNKSAGMSMVLSN